MTRSVIRIETKLTDSCCCHCVAVLEAWLEVRDYDPTDRPLFFLSCHQMTRCAIRIETKLTDGWALLPLCCRTRSLARSARLNDPTDRPLFSLSCPRAELTGGIDRDDSAKLGLLASLYVCPGAQLNNHCSDLLDFFHTRSNVPVARFSSKMIGIGIGTWTQECS